MVFILKNQHATCQHELCRERSEKEAGQRGQVGQFCYKRGEKKESKQKRENKERERERDMPLLWGRAALSADFMPGYSLSA